VKRLYRRVKEFGGDCFRVLPLSVIIKKEQLNPFESSVTLRGSRPCKLFSCLFQHQLRNKLKFAHESEDRLSNNYIESNSGICYIRVKKEDSSIAFSENDIVNNTLSGYGNANALLKKVEDLILCVEILAELIKQIT